MYGSPGSQFFRITTGTQPRPNAFDELRSVMTFLSKFRVTGTSSSFRLNLKGKAGKEIPEPSRFELSEKLSVNSFCFIACRRKHLRTIKWRKNSRFNFAENTISNSQNATTVKFLRSHIIFGFFSINKFDSFKNLLATITSLPELHVRHRRYILLV